MPSAAPVSSVRDALAAAEDALRAAGIDSPRLDAELLLAHAMGVSREALYMDSTGGVPAPAARSVMELIRRRVAHEPVAYIVGTKGFRHIELAVDSRVLIPRPETELMVELALELAPGRVLDVGTGSGAIALAIAAELPGCEVVATDISPAALEVARENARRLGLAARVELIEATVPADGGPFDLALANLPYVSEAEWPALEPEVTEWEPRQALLAGADGLDVLRATIPALAGVAPVLALEVGPGQAAQVSEWLVAAGFSAVGVRADLAGVPRLVVGREERIQ
jgi:release factor glutamine methyltransferase